ncbi:MAG: hypothetical protein IAE96_00125 [Chitinophagaceae bacterium]|nr:hypothetical protein [Chitinophagaceae bacterium]
MESNQDQSLFDTGMDHLTESHLQTISKWTRFIAITGYVAMGLVLLMFLLIGGKLAEQISVLSTFSDMGFAGVMLVVVIIALAIAGLWLYFLLKGSSLIRSGLQNRDSVMLADGFRALKTYFIFSVVFSVLSLFTTLATIF